MVFIALFRRPLRCIAFALALASSGGCAAEVYPPTVGGYTTVYASSVPPNMAAYPRVSYAGGYAYLANGRWYYPYGSRWVVLQHEPPELYRYRTTYVAPPVRPYPPGYLYRPAPPAGYYPYPPR